MRTNIFKRVDLIENNKFVLSVTMNPLMMKPLIPSLLFLFWSTACWKFTTSVPIQLHGLNYNTRKGPDWDWDKCKTDTEVLIDLTILSRVTNRIRLLSMTDCGQTAQVLRIAKDLGTMQFWIGLWVGLDASVFEQEKAELIRLINEGMIEESTIVGISVGSEAIYREDATVDEMIANMNEGALTNQPYWDMNFAIILWVGLTISVKSQIIVAGSRPQHSIDYL